MFYTIISLLVITNESFKINNLCCVNNLSIINLAPSIVRLCLLVTAWVFDIHL